MTGLLEQLNQLITGAGLIIAFSMLTYLARHNWGDRVVRAFCLLMVSVIIVLSGKILVAQAQLSGTIEVLIRAQWLGIAFIPAAYLHLADALLSSTGSVWPLRRWFVRASYAASTLFFALALLTNALVYDAERLGPFTKFNSGPLLWFFTLYFLAATIGGLLGIRRARRRSLSPSVRRRLFYLSMTFLAPAGLVLPYLFIATTNSEQMLSANLLLALASIANLGITAMVVVMAYSMAFHGALLPERLVKYNFLRFMLYGPAVGVLVAICMLLVTPLARLLGLPTNTVIIFGVMIMTVFTPLFIGLVRPTLDLLVYRQDREEVTSLRQLDRHIFTRSDLRHLLENTLMAVCGRLGVETGFVAAPGDDGLVVQASCGSRRMIRRFLADNSLNELAEQLLQTPRRRRDLVPDSTEFVQYSGWTLLPLAVEGELIGVIGIEATRQPLAHDARQLIGALAHQMELAIANVELQRGIYASLRQLGPEMISLQRLTSELEQATHTSSTSSLEPDLALQPEFSQLVKDALSHYWGGPKLSDSPLLGLRTVRQLLHDQGSSPTKALQAVLRQAIENLRPSEQLDPTAQEWLLYNILELRFLQGLRIREIAERLALSESDLYRKQRVAVAEVARQLALMEESQPAANAAKSSSKQP